MNMLMQTYIEQVRTEPKRYVQDKTACARLLNLPSKFVEKGGVPVMYRDSWMGFTNFLCAGLDFDFLMLDVLSLSFIELAARLDMKLQSRIIMGILFAYLLDNFLLWMRMYLGRRNLAKHTLSDEKFLV